LCSQAAAPDPCQIPTNDIVGVTVILLTASYKGKEFVRVGYYVNTEYDTPELRALYPDTELVTDEMIKMRPDPPIIPQLVRNVLAEKPRVTRFKITWYDATFPIPCAFSFNPFFSWGSTAHIYTHPTSFLSLL
jgi:histone chaperone ASF1